jgi:sugar phosphate isomerase/epimerase
MKPLPRRHFLAGLAGAGLYSVSRPLYGKTPADPLNPQMEICLFSKHLQWLDYDGMAETAAKLGLDGLDLTVRPGGHVEPENVRKDLPRAVKAVQQAGLKVSMMTTAITDPDDPMTEPVLETAAEHGIRYYRLGYYRYDENRDIIEQLNGFKSKMHGLARLNKKYQVHGAYQNHAGSSFVGASLWDIWEMVKDEDPEWLGCQFDIRHATVESGQTWPMLLKLLLPYTKVIIAKDFRWEQTTEKKWKPENCPLGTGMVDFDSYFNKVKQAQIPGPISLHLEFPLGGADKGKRSLAWPRDYVLSIMEKEVETLKYMLQKAEL